MELFDIGVEGAKPVIVIHFGAVRCQGLSMV